MSERDPRVLTSADTNVLFAAVVPAAAGHASAVAFLREQAAQDDFVVSELVLVELYVLLRNPAVVARPLSPSDAVAVVDSFRRHPRWRLIDHDRDVMGEVWKHAGSAGFARGRIFDVRLALGLVRHGVVRFATRNVRHFEGLGFEHLTDPFVI